MSEGIPSSPSAKFLEEAQLRAKERDSHKGAVARVFGRKESAMGLVQEEADLMNAQIDEHRSHMQGMSNAEAMEVVGARKEFAHLSEDEIKAEESLRAWNPEVFDAIKRNDFDTAESLFYKNIDLLNKKKGYEASREITKEYRRLKQRQLESSFEGGNITAIRSALESFQADRELFLLIPQDVVKSREGKALVRDMLTGREVYRDLGELADTVRLFKAQGFIESSDGIEARLTAKLSERFVRDLGEKYSPEGIEEKISSYAASGLLGDAEALAAIPGAREQIIDKLLLKIVHGDAQYSAEAGRSLIERFARLKVVGSAEDLIAMPEIQHHYRSKLETRLIYGTRNYDPAFALEEIERDVETGLVGTLEEWKANPAVRKHYTEKLVTKLVYGEGSYSADKARSIIEAFEKTGLTDPIAKLRTTDSSLEQTLAKLGL